MDTENRNKTSRQELERITQKRKARRKVWRVIRPITIALLSVAICVACIAVAYNFVMERFFLPVDSSDARPVTITISSGAGASSIAKKLYEAGGVDEDGNILEPGLIASKTVFKIYVDFMGKSDKLKAGTYVLSRNMDVGQIVDIICEGNPPRTTLKLVITEGMTAEQIAQKLVELGVLSSSSEFLDLCRTGEAFMDHSIVKSVAENMSEERKYALEGYLFPDTYEIYSDESPKSIINRLLYRYEQLIDDKYIARAKEMGMTVDEVISLAALIEKEAKVDSDFAKVSAVFHNRLKTGMTLGSDVTIKYASGVKRMSLTNQDLNIDSPFNSYKHKGLPPGPICSPSAGAIRAALYPDEDFIAQQYLYFCSKDPGTGELHFSRTLAEHELAVSIYAPLWQAWDREQGL